MAADPQVISLLFSDFFKVSQKTVEDYGAFDVSLVADLPLFVDPFLLFNSKKPNYQELHERMIKYLRFLRDKSSQAQLNEGLIRAWFFFPEVPQNWLGFARTSNRGRGLGRAFANALHENLGKLCFGDERISRGSHIEKLCLIRRGVGRDNISDFTNNLIRAFLLEYTQTFARRYIDASLRKDFSVPKVLFNYGTESWGPGVYNLPYYKGDFVLLTPRDLLTKDDTWINKGDLIHDFDRIPNAIPDAALRAQVNNYFQKLLPKKPKKEDIASAKASTLLQFPELIDYYIKTKEQEGDEAESLASKKVQFSRALYLSQFTRLPYLLQQNTSFYATPGLTYEEARRRVQFLKDIIENKGGYRIFYIEGEPIQREEDLHVLYRMTWFASVSDVTPEANDGRGPADFKVSHGSRDKTLVEFKLASNSHLKRNLKNQTKIYEVASDAKKTIKVIVYFTASERKHVDAILAELDMTGDKEVFLIDARNDNKPSASKA
jgi:hypothetical protein